jgi:hypothetical protein
MRKVVTASVILALLLFLTARAQNAKETNKLEPLPRDLEIQLALSALPPHLRDSATVYVLNPDIHCPWMIPAAASVSVAGTT